MVPAVVVLALDTSGSIKPQELESTRHLAESILAGLPSGGEVAVIAFDDQSRLLQPRTSNPAQVRKALGSLRISGRYTALYDALYDASRYLRDVPSGRRAIVLVTDGKDENSALNLDDGLRVAEESQIPVFSIGIGRVEERVLRRIAKLTGGDYQPIRSATGTTLALRILAMPVATGPTASGAESAAGVRPHPDRPGAAAPSGAAGEAPTGSAAIGAGTSDPRAAPHPALGGSPPADGSAHPGAGGFLRPAVLGLVVVLTALAGAFLAFRRRPEAGTRCPRCDRPLPSPLSPCAFCAREAAGAGHTLPPPTAAELSDTVLARMNQTEEYLEKTITLRETLVLAVTDGPKAGQVHALSPAVATSLGRARVNDIILDDVAVSSQHCRIRPEEGRFVLHDLKSTNGTFINERRVSAPHPLEEGDVIKIGETRLQFRLEHERA